jgi:hypothetical protein
VKPAFAPSVAAAIDAIKYLYIRAGDKHRFIPIWVVVVDGRVFVRPWNDKAGGWYHTFLRDKHGAIIVNDKEIPVHAKPAKGEKLNDAVDAAYATKYTTKANQKYVTGFSTAKRRATTMELLPNAIRSR